MPCGGGVDSSLLGAYLKKRGHKVVYWCINQPDAPRTEREWMDPLSKAMGIPCVYADLAKQDFIENLVETICSTQQPLTGPNAVGGVFARKMALAEGYQHYVSGEFCDTIFGGLSPNVMVADQVYPAAFAATLSNPHAADQGLDGGRVLVCRFDAGRHLRRRREGWLWTPACCRKTRGT